MCAFRLAKYSAWWAKKKKRIVLPEQYIVTITVIIIVLGMATPRAHRRSKNGFRGPPRSRAGGVRTRTYVGRVENIKYKMKKKRLNLKIPRTAYRAQYRAIVLSRPCTRKFRVKHSISGWSRAEKIDQSNRSFFEMTHTWAREMLNSGLVARIGDTMITEKNK